MKSVSVVVSEVSKKKTMTNKQKTLKVTELKSITSDKISEKKENVTDPSLLSSSLSKKKLLKADKSGVMTPMRSSNKARTHSSSSNSEIKVSQKTENFETDRSKTPSLRSKFTVRSHRGNIVIESASTV